MNVVGSKKRNMITQNANEPIDFDFNPLFCMKDQPSLLHVSGVATYQVWH